MLINFPFACEYGKNPKFLLAEWEKVTAAYFISRPLLCDVSIEFLRATFPLSNSQPPIEAEPSITITLSVGRVVLLRRLFVELMSKKLVNELSCSDFGGGNHFKLCK